MPKVKVKVTKDGIIFGECFINHDAIIGERGPVVLKNYKDWLEQALRPCPHKMGTGPEGKDICAYCMERWPENDKWEE